MTMDATSQTAQEHAGIGHVLMCLDECGELCSQLDTTTDPQGLLIGAAAVIERVGLHRGEYWPGAELGGRYHRGDPCCLLGALLIAAGYGQCNPEWAICELAIDDAAEAVQIGLGLGDAPGTAVHNWNDEPSRTAEEVAAALRAGTAHLSEGAQP